MSAIFGIVRFDGRAANTSAASAMAVALQPWGDDPATTAPLGGAVFGHLVRVETPEDVFVTQPAIAPDRPVLLTAEGRVDKRPEIIRALGLDAVTASTIADADVIGRAYLAWGPSFAERVVGDWSLAAWHADDRRLILARDHSGNTPLFWHRDVRTGDVVFASDRRALHAAGVPRALDEVRLAAVLVSWPGDDPFSTIDRDIRRVPPAHVVEVSASGEQPRRYWFPEDREPGPDRPLTDYAEELRAVLGEATRARCRAPGDVAVTLSGGLDSGSVTALAVPAVHANGSRIRAYTQVPIASTTDAVGQHRFGDEGPLATSVAAFTGVDEHVLLDCTEVGPVLGVERSLGIHDEPVHAASNAFWITELLGVASRSAGVVLTGQGGNASISWDGSATYLMHVRAHGLRGALGYWLPEAVQRRRVTHVLQRTAWENVAIAPAFADRIDLADRIGHALGRAALPLPARAAAITRRAAVIQPGTSRIGDIWATSSAYSGVDVRDPTLDPRVIEAAWRIPDTLFRPRTGPRRAVIRTAMTGLLPDEVRLNTDRGRQSADLVTRLRRTRADVDAALAEIAGTHAEEFVSVTKLRGAWHAAQSAADPHTTHRAGSILLRGMMAGLWLARTYG